MKYAQPLLTVVGVMVAIIAFYTVGPMLETRFWPVYSRFRIVEAVDTPDGLRVVARFTKYRDCAPQGYGWYVGEFGIMRQVITRSSDTVITRPMGMQLGTFVVKDLTLKDLPYLYAEVYHNCYPLWTTRSIIYP